jgi:hypothetical protein
LADRIDATQTVLRRRILIENPATYLRFAGDGLSEPQFLGALASLSGCGLLLDVNNVHVSAVNHGFDAEKYLDAFPLSQVEEIHLAGFAEAQDACGAFLIDNHGDAVSDEVWALYQHVLRRAGPRPTLIEWDNDVPEWEVLFAETRKASEMMGELPFSPCGRRGREAPDEGALRESAPSSVSPAASHLLPQGEKGGTAIIENWQAQFAQALQNPALPPPQLFADCDLSARFAVYRNNSAVAAISALKAQFPNVALLVGDEAFAGLARLFVQKFPPRSPVLGEYGAAFPAFLETFPGISQTPYLADSARLDWACLIARRAPEATPRGAARLLELDPARIGEQLARLHPSLTLVASNWPILAIAQAHETPVREWRGETVLVLRPWDELVSKPCPPGAAVFLRACLEGKNLGEAALLAGGSDETFDFGQTLVELTLIGAIVDFTEQEGEPE